MVLAKERQAAGNLETLAQGENKLDVIDGTMLHHIDARVVVVQVVSCHDDPRHTLRVERNREVP